MGERTIVGLDIGTNVTRVVVGEVNENDELSIVATATRPSEGMQDGIIVNIVSAKDNIRQAIEAAENAAGIIVDSVVVGIGGTTIESQNSRGVTPITPNAKGARREITQEDVNNAMEIATAINYPFDREKIHTVPQDFIVDGIGGISNPVNRIGVKLEAEVHVVTASKNVIQNLSDCIYRANYNLDRVMLKTLAQAYAICHKDELELGSIIIDLGAATTDVIVLLDDAPICTASVKVGGNLITNDVAIVTGIPASAAEKIKVEEGCCWLPGIVNDTDVMLPGIGGRAPELIAKSQLCEIIQARMEQIFTMVKQAIVKNSNNSIKQLSGNIILTGGGAQMEGVIDLAQAVFKTSSVRLGVPESLGGNEAEYRRPDFATAIGLVVAEKTFGAKTTVKRKNHKRSDKGSGAKGSFAKFLKIFF